MALIPVWRGALHAHAGRRLLQAPYTFWRASTKLNLTKIFFTFSGSGGLTGGVAEVGVAGVVLAGHGREGVSAQVAPVAREPLGGVVVVWAVEAVAGHALLLQLHQGLDLVVRLRVRAAPAVRVAGVGRPGQLTEVENVEAVCWLVRGKSVSSLTSLAAGH